MNSQADLQIKMLSRNIVIEKKQNQNLKNKNIMLRKKSQMMLKLLRRYRNLLLDGDGVLGDDSFGNNYGVSYLDSLLEDAGMECGEDYIWKIKKYLNLNSEKFKMSSESKKLGAGETYGLNEEEISVFRDRFGISLKGLDERSPLFVKTLRVLARELVRADLLTPWYEKGNHGNALGQNNDTLEHVSSVKTAKSVGFDESDDFDNMDVSLKPNTKFNLGKDGHNLIDESYQLGPSSH